MRLITIISFFLTTIIFTACRSQPAPEFPAGAFGHDHYVYIGNEYQVQVYDVSRADDLRLIASWDVPGRVRRIVTDGSKAYVIHRPSSDSWLSETTPADGGVQLVDISQPDRPQIQGYFHDRSGAEDLFLHGKLVYVADWEGLYVVEWSVPDKPRELINLSQRSGSIEVDGALLLGVWGGCGMRSGPCTGGLWLVDISQPQKPLFLGEISSEQSPAYDIALLKTPTNQYALVAGRGLWVVDISNPALPQEVVFQEVTDGFYHSRIVVKEHYAILASDANIRVYDMSQPEKPLLIGQMEWYSPPLDMMLASDGYHVYVATWDGLSIVDVRDPQRPFLVASNHTPILPPMPTLAP